MELDGEANGADQLDVMGTVWRDHDPLAGVRSQRLIVVLEAEADRSLVHDQTSPHTGGDAVGTPEAGGHRLLIEDVGGASELEPVGEPAEERSVAGTVSAGAVVALLADVAAAIADLVEPAGGVAGVGSTTGGIAHDTRGYEFSPGSSRVLVSGRS